MIMFPNIMIFLIRSAQMKRLTCFVRFYYPSFIYTFSFRVLYCLIAYLTFYSHEIVDCCWLSQNCPWCDFLSRSGSSEILGANTLYMVSCSCLHWFSFSHFCILVALVYIFLAFHLIWVISEFNIICIGWNLKEIITLNSWQSIVNTTIMLLSVTTIGTGTLYQTICCT